MAQDSSGTADVRLQVQRGECNYMFLLFFPSIRSTLLRCSHFSSTLTLDIRFPYIRRRLQALLRQQGRVGGHGSPTKACGRRNTESTKNGN